MGRETLVPCRPSILLQSLAVTAEFPVAPWIAWWTRKPTPGNPGRVFMR